VALLLAAYALAFGPLLHALLAHEGLAPQHDAQAHAWAHHGRVSDVQAPDGAAGAPHDEDVPHAHAPADAHPHAPADDGEAPPEGHTHPGASTEHLQVAVLLSPPPLVPTGRWTLLPRPPDGRARATAGVPWRPTAMPQGP
jgi:hypothetical protein